VKRTAPANIFKQASLTIETCAARSAVSQMDRYISALPRFQFVIQIQTHPVENFFAVTHKLFFQTAFAAALGCQLTSARLSFARARPNRDMTVPAGHESIVAIS
jgi:hypothetical protein